MIKAHQPRTFCFITLIIIAIVGLQLAGCAGNKTSNTEIIPLTKCPTVRPQLCTMDYKPVCGQMNDGTLKTYPNDCSSCADMEVVGFRKEECAPVK